MFLVFETAVGRGLEVVDQRQHALIQEARFASRVVAHRGPGSPHVPGRDLGVGEGAAGVLFGERLHRLEDVPVQGQRERVLRLGPWVVADVEVVAPAGGQQDPFAPDDPVRQGQRRDARGDAERHRGGEEAAGRRARSGRAPGGPGSPDHLGRIERPERLGRLRGPCRAAEQQRDERRESDAEEQVGPRGDRHTEQQPAAQSEQQGAGARSGRPGLGPARVRKPRPIQQEEAAGQEEQGERDRRQLDREVQQGGVEGREDPGREADPSAEPPGGEHGQQPAGDGVRQRPRRPHRAGITLAHDPEHQPDDPGIERAGDREGTPVEGKPLAARDALAQQQVRQIPAQRRPEERVGLLEPPLEQPHRRREGGHRDESAQMRGTGGCGHALRRRGSAGGTGRDAGRRTVSMIDPRRAPGNRTPSPGAR